MRTSGQRHRAHRRLSFSRCASSPGMASTGGDSSGRRAPRATDGERLPHPRAAFWAAAPNAALPIPTPARASDTTPSIWRGVVSVRAAARPGTGTCGRCCRWSPNAPREAADAPPRRDPGAMRSHRPGCRPSPAQGEVRALASDGSIVTFVWSVFGGLPGPRATQELRIDRANGRGATLAAGEVRRGGLHARGRRSARARKGHLVEPPLVVREQCVVRRARHASAASTGFAGVLASHGAAAGYGSERQARRHRRSPSPTTKVALRPHRAS